MSFKIKDDAYSDTVTIGVWQNGLSFICEHDENDYNVVVDIDKQKTVELIEFLQECVKEMI